MAKDEHEDAPDPGTDDRAEPKETDLDTDDTEGQALTWKMRNPIPEVEEDAEGHSVRSSPEQIELTIPALNEDEDDAEGNGGATGSVD